MGPDTRVPGGPGLAPRISRVQSPLVSCGGTLASRLAPTGRLGRGPRPRPHARRPLMGNCQWHSKRKNFESACPLVPHPEQAPQAHPPSSADSVPHGLPRPRLRVGGPTKNVEVAQQKTPIQVKSLYSGRGALLLKPLPLNPDGTHSYRRTTYFRPSSSLTNVPLPPAPDTDVGSESAGRFSQVPRSK